MIESYLVEGEEKVFELNIYEANDADFKKSLIRIYHDAKNPSRIILPVLN